VSNVIESFFVSLGFEVDTAKVEEFKKKTEELRASVLKVGAIFTGAAVGIGMMVLKVAEGMDDVGDFADIVGMSAREVAALGKVADQNDSSMSAMQSTLQGISQTTGEAAMGVGRAAKIFEMLGFSAKDATGKTKSAYDMLGEVADRMKGMGASERLALAGKMGIDASLIPLLSKGSEKFRELAESAKAANPLTDEQYAQADEIVKLWNKATAGVSGYTKLLAAKLFPVMKKILVAYNDWVSSVKKGGGSAVADAFKLASSFAETLWEWLVRLVDKVKGTYQWLTQFKAVTWLAGAAVAALIAYKAGLFFAALGEAVLTAARALFTFSAAGALPVILFGLIGLAIAAVVDDLINFYEGNESVIGLLSKDFPNAIYGVWAALVALGGAFVALKWKAITSMLETMAIMAMYAGEWIAAHAAMAVGALVAYWPIILIIGAIAAAVGAVWYLWQNWDKVTALLKDAWEAVKTALTSAFDSVISVFDAAKQKVMGFIDTVMGAIGKVGKLLGLTDEASNVRIAVSGANGSSAQSAPSPLSMPGGVMGSAASNVSNASTVNASTNISGTTINISSPDPTKAGQSVMSEFERRDKAAIRS
jgi:hypothetical protein